MEFTATESGFENGLGGASNSAGASDHHYVLFGRQVDDQHPDQSGVYFECDDQIHGKVDCVTKIVIQDGLVEFKLRDQEAIMVRRGMEASQWDSFLKGIHEVFGSDIVHKV